MTELLRLRLFLLALIALAGLAGWSCRHRLPVSTDLTDLIPTLHDDRVMREAQQHMTSVFSRQLIVLIGATQGTQAVTVAKTISEQWRASGQFDRVDFTANMNLVALRRQLLEQGLALARPSQRQTLIDDPARFVKQRLQTLMSPVSVGGLIPLGQDWLGWANQAAVRLAPPGPVQLDLASDTLQVQDTSRTWVVLRASTRQSALGGQGTASLQYWLAQAREDARQQGATLLATGGPLFAAAAQTQAIRESTLIGGGGVLGIIAILLLSLRRLRTLFVFIPLAIGILSGFVCCVLVFGTMHLLILAVGISLIGIAADFPLHWLSQAFGPGHWQAWPALRRVDGTLIVSLIVTLIGYAALALTPFPALTQIAVFSTAGLLGAYLTTVALLPRLLRKLTPAPAASIQRVAKRILAVYPAHDAKRLRAALLIVALLCVGLQWHRLRLQDDIRLWLSPSASLQTQARRVGEITHYLPTSQFFLIQAADTDTLLRREQVLQVRLDAQKRAGHLDGDTALSQVLAPQADQRRVQAALPDNVATNPAWQPLLALGIAPAILQADIRRWKAQPTVTIDDFVDGPAGLRWRPLWLGRQAHGQFASIVSLSGLHDLKAVAKAAQGLPGVRWVDPVGRINHLFTQTRIRAVYLKLVSYTLAAVVLCACFGWRTSLRITACAATATLCAVALMATLHVSLTLFGIFGLLLASAIGIDYALFLYRSHAGYEASYIGIVLSALTTLLTFGLLACSATPVLANFGLAVTLGVAFNVLWAPVFLHRRAVQAKGAH